MERIPNVRVTNTSKVVAVPQITRFLFALPPWGKQSGTGMRSNRNKGSEVCNLRVSKVLM